MSHRATLGLRERKKARTRARIRRQALRLIQAQGFAATTVEQIAEAAEVSQSTFFRYFPTKEEVVLQDDFDALFLEAFEAQPAELSPIRALRKAMHAVLGELSPEELEQERARTTLVLSTPELRERLLVETTRTIQLLAEAVAARVGRQADDFAVRTFTGALIGVAGAALLSAIDDPTADFYALIDASFAQLEAGLPL